MVERCLQTFVLIVLFLLLSCPAVVQAETWVERSDAPCSGGYGEAVVGTTDAIYVARCLYATSTPSFSRYNPDMDSWTPMSISGLPSGVFRSGTALAWDHDDHIYALCGGRYKDTNRKLFYRYNISGNIWEQLADTPHAQGAGDAITWSEHDDHVYAMIGSNARGTVFARYNYNLWETLTFNPNWALTDDGASLVSVGEHLYALRGEYSEHTPNGDFARYHIPTAAWTDMSDIPESDGIGDGGSLLYIGDWMSEHDDHIFALGGGGVYEDPGYNFYRYSISGNDWEQLKQISCPIGFYVGNRLGYANNHIYYWQGSPMSDLWVCGGDAFYMFNWSGEIDPPALIVINEIEQNPSGTDAGNEWVELYNPTTSDVDLDGWKLSTTHGVTVTVTLHGTIPANGYFAYTHTEQWLDNEVESVTLRDPSWNKIDRTPYLTDTSNGYYSWQRYPNGEDTDSDSDWEFRASTIGRNNNMTPITIYVDDDFVDDPSNHKWNAIQKGMNAAFNGDTIIVKDGIYIENLNVHKRLTIQSENGSDVTIVQGAASSDHVFEVTADYVNITGFTTSGTEYPGAGIYLYGVDHCNASCNNVSNNWKGICLWYSSDNAIIDNNASNNSYDLYLSYSSGNTLTNDCGSIHLDSSSNNKITNNTCSNHYMGIYLSSSSNNTLTGNTISNNTHGIYLSCSSNNNTLTCNNASNNECGIDLGSSSGNTLTSNIADSNRDKGIRVSGSDENEYNNSISITNTVNGKPIYYFFNKNGVVLDGLDAGHLTLAYCSDCTIKNNNVSNGDGIYLYYSSNNTLTSNTANSNSDYGIYLSSSSNNTLTSNRMSDNKYNFGVSGCFDNNIDTTNLVDGKPVHHIKSADGATFDHNTHADAGTIYCIQCNNITIKDITLTNNGAGVFFWKTNNSRIENVNISNNSKGIHLQYSSNNMLTDNNASNNYWGIYSYHSSNNTLVSNTCFSNWLGILLWGTSNSTLTSNTCSNNNDDGICMYLSGNNTLTGNRCSNNNDGGIILWKSCNNLLYHNNLINNNGNAYDYSSDFSSDPLCINFWNSSTEGNYYSDYAGCDNDPDGIGDAPHPIPLDGVDYFPLMQPWSEDMQQKGDLNGDGQITAADVLIALQIAVRGEYRPEADMYENGYVNALDARAIMHVVV